MFATSWKTIKPYFRPHGTPGISQFRAVPGGTGKTKMWLRGIPGSRKHYFRSFENVVMMLKAYSGLFWPVTGFIVY